jgi:hypothetical protein
MTHCLNCGAVRTADQCEACGLTSAAAGVVLRRRLVNRTGVFLLGSLTFLWASHRYPPLELDAVLIFFGVTFFLALALAVWVERAALRFSEVEITKRIFYALLPVPWLLAGLLLINGRFDASPPANWTTAVVGKFSMSALLPSRRLIVHSWQDGRRFERVAVDRGDYDRFQVGDRVVVRMQQGLVGIPWVDSVYRP